MYPDMWICGTEMWLFPPFDTICTNHEKHPWRSGTFRLQPATLLNVTLLMGVFHVFWIVQMVANREVFHKIPALLPRLLCSNAGAIELNVLCSHYEMEINVADVQSGRIDRFGKKMLFWLILFLILWSDWRHQFIRENSNSKIPPLWRTRNVNKWSDSQ